MIRFISYFKKKKELERGSGGQSTRRSDRDGREAPTAETRRDFDRSQHNGIASRFSTVTKDLLLKASLGLTGAFRSGESLMIGGEETHDSQSEEVAEKIFTRFEELPMEIKLVIFEYYLEQPRIVTLHFSSNALIHYSQAFGRSFKVCCGAAPPILRLNNRYRDHFLERLTTPGSVEMRLNVEKTISRMDEVGHDDEVDWNSEVYWNDGTFTSSMIPAYDTRTRRNIIYQPRDVIWIQGDFWLDELRRSSLARSVFHDLQHLAVSYVTRNGSLFKTDDLWWFVKGIISSFPDLKTVTLVLDFGDVLMAEGQIDNSEVNFIVPEDITVISNVTDTRPLHQRLLSELKSLGRGKNVHRAGPKEYVISTVYSPELVAASAHQTLRHIKRICVQDNIAIPVSAWEEPRAIADWIIPDIYVATASLSTSSLTTDKIHPTIKFEAP